MFKYINIKTNRSRYGFLPGKIVKFINSRSNKIEYAFKYRTIDKRFKTYEKVREFVETNYELIDTNLSADVKEYHLPKEEKEFFK